MENTYQPMPIAGYTEQRDDRIGLVNANKVLEEVVLRAIDALYADGAIDKRWLAIGRTHTQQAFMALNRAIMQPCRIALPDDPPSEQG